MNIQEYSVALSTSFESKKNASAVAREVGSSQSSTSRFLNQVNLTHQNFEPLIKAIFGNKKLNFIIDDTTLNKRYSKEIEGVSSMIDQSTKTFTNGYKVLTAGLTDGEYFLPIDIEHWVAEFIMGDKYLTIIQLAQKLILRVLEKTVKLGYFVMDGLYFSKEFIFFLNEKSLEFVIKAKTTTVVEHQGKKMQLRNCKDLRLNSNQRAKSIVAVWNGQKWYFIAVLRSGKRGSTIIYLIANFKTKSRIYAKIYDSRWKTEKFYRTGKQSLGLKNCLSLNATTYLNHLKCVFYAYGLLQFLMKKLRLKSVEEAIRQAQYIKLKYGFTKAVDQLSLLEVYA